MTAPRVHLDAAAGLPLHPAGRAALLASLADGWADPGQLYGAGRRARLLLDSARASVAAALGARPDEVRFTPGGPTTAHLAVLGALAGRRRTGTHVVHSAIEHSAVLAALDLAESDRTVIPVSRVGRVEPAVFAAALRPDTALACLLAASHEVGTVQPVAQVARACADAGVPLLVDATHTVGRMPPPPGWSLLTADAPLWGGPPGVGVLVVRTGVRWRSPWPATEGEWCRDLPGIVAAAAALEAVGRDSAAEDARLRALVDRIRERVDATVPDVQIVGDPVDRLPHLVTFSCLYVQGEALLRALDQEGFAVSSGSSCTASTLEPSHVLVAMGVLTHGNIRVSLPPGVSAAEVDRFLAVLPTLVARLREDAGAGGL